MTSRSQIRWPTLAPDGDTVEDIELNPVEACLRLQTGKCAGTRPRPYIFSLIMIVVDACLKVVHLTLPERDHCRSHAGNCQSEMGLVPNTLPSLPQSIDSLFL